MTNREPEILIADDEEGIRFVLRDILENQGYRVTEAEDGEQALTALKAGEPDLLILDLNMPKVNGMEVLRQGKKLYPGLIVLMITAYGSTELALEAMREGAYDYFTKPFDMHELRNTIHRALEKKQLTLEQKQLKNQIKGLKSIVSARARFGEIIGSCDAMQDMFDMMDRVIDNDVPILVTGESGTGKEMVVDAIHSRGPRADAPLVKINCAAIPEQLLESELFGHEKGSFTGAEESRPGKFEQAQGGTLFLDEIGEMPLSLQPKILRALQEREVQRVGGEAPIPIDVRLITATNRNLAEEVAAKRFREDLFFRINVIVLEIPPLRRRLTDIPLLTEHFIGIYNERLRKSIESVSPEVMKIFLRYPWPGNIRELENAIQRALIMAGSEEIAVQDLPESIHAAPDATLDLDMSMPEQVEWAIESVERALITKALKQTHGREETAKRLGISRKSLHNKMQKYGIRD